LVGDTTFEAPLSALNANLESVKAQLGLQDSTRTARLSVSSQHESPDQQITSPSIALSEPVRGLRVGSRFLPFPSPRDYSEYIDFFFEDINPCHSCVNEAAFRQSNKKLRRCIFARGDDICFLALNYIIFACADILRNVEPVQQPLPCPGWNWFLAADSLLGKRKLSGQADLCLIQFLIYEAFYLMHADKSSAAYNAIGIACRLSFQFGLHNQPRWDQRCDPFSIHMRQRVFWTVYFVDRRIALSCGRPYGIRDSDIRVEKPAWLHDKALSPGHPLPPSDPDRSAIMYLICMVEFGKLAGDVWDTMFAANGDTFSTEAVAILDAKIRHWLENTLPKIPLLPSQIPLTQRHRRQQLLVDTRLFHLRLLLHRREMVSLSYNATVGLLCGNLATNIVRRLEEHRLEINQPSSFRFHLATTLGGAILILATLLCRDLTTIGLQDRHAIFSKSFHTAVEMLKELAQVLRAARRIADDLDTVVNSVTSILLRSSFSPQNNIGQLPEGTFDNFFPHTDADVANLGQLPESGVSEMGGQTVESTFNYDIFATLDSWDSYFQANTGDPGVPWI